MSLKKIAELAGTSVSTVSRVLNSPEHVCNEPGLADRIWKIAQSQHYLPNAAARNLRLGVPANTEHFTVDIFLTRFDSMDKDPFFRELFQHLKEDLLQRDCLLGKVLNSLEVLESNDKFFSAGPIPYKPTQQIVTEKAKYPLAFISQKPNTGLIVLGKCPKEFLPLLKKRYAYIVGIDRNPTEYEYDEVICNGTIAAEMAVEHLISLGHRDIAYIGDCTYETRYIGYYQALIRHKLPLNYTRIYPTDQSREEGARTMTAVLASSQRPTAIFCANDCTALGVVDTLKRTKKRGYFPSIISIDNIKDSQKTTPMLTTIDIPKKEMGRLALTLLLDRKNGYHKENVRLELPCHLVERESCTYAP